ncbi:MAG TPA: hypothetical protein VFF04_04870 [Candidatus Babeliales bacterium]|nr:hypothetical protein [Candidatus Babeliales bacterium]
MNYKKVIFAIFFMTITPQAFTAEKSLLKITSKALFSGEQPNNFWKNYEVSQTIRQKNIQSRQQWRNDLFTKMGIIMGGAAILRTALVIGKRVR